MRGFCDVGFSGHTRLRPSGLGLTPVRPLSEGLTPYDCVMPSPLGHALGGMAAGWLVARPARGSAVDVVKSGAWFAVLGIVPDLDLLLGPHRAATHSFVAALIVGLAAA